MTDSPVLPPSIAWCVAEGLLASGSEHYRVHRAAHVLAHQLDWLTFVASRFMPADAETPWLVEIEGQVVCPNVVILRPSVLTAVRFDDNYSDLEAGQAWDAMRVAVAHAQSHGQIMMLDLDDHPYAWNEYHPEARITPEQWESHDRYVQQFNAVLCSTEYLVDVMEARFLTIGEQLFEYAPNLYDPFRYDPEKAKFGKTIGTHIFVKARDQADFDVLGKMLAPVLEADPELTFLHIGEEFAGSCCGHPIHHHFENQLECDDCACEKFEPGDFDNLAKATGLPWDRIEPAPACMPSQMPDVLPQINVGIVPLADSIWNYAKTEGKGFEYAAAGIPFVALTGDHPLYKKSVGNGALTWLYSWVTFPTSWEDESKRVRKWAESIAQEHQIDYVATMVRLAQSDLSK